YFFFSSRRRHTRFSRDWSSDVCSSDLFDTELGRTSPTTREIPGRCEGALCVFRRRARKSRGEQVFLDGFSSARVWRARVRSKRRSEERRVGKAGRWVGEVDILTGD